MRCRITKSPEILVMVETKTQSSKMDKIMRISTFDSMAVSEAHGFSGGIWTFWESKMVDIKVATINEQTMVLLILEGDKIKWMLTPLYALPNVACRAGLWEYFQKLGRKVDLPWLLVGIKSTP